MEHEARGYFIRLYLGCKLEHPRSAVCVGPFVHSVSLIFLIFQGNQGKITSNKVVPFIHGFPLRFSLITNLAIVGTDQVKIRTQVTGVLHETPKSFNEC